MLKLSVIIPVYNVEKYIERCARSLFEQTLDDIEFIFIDDSSTDNSIQILNDTLKEYPRRVSQTQVISLPINSGIAAVRKYGIQLSKGEYIIQCDSDDWVEINMYEQMYNYAKQHSCEIVICDYFRYIDSENIQTVKTYQADDSIKLNKRLLSGSVHASVWNKLVHSSLYLDNEIMYPKDNMCEDLVLMFQLIFHAKKIGYLPVPYYYYYYNQESISQSVTLDSVMAKAISIINNCNLIVLFLSRKNALKEFYSDIINFKIRVKYWNNELVRLYGRRDEWDLIFGKFKMIEILKSSITSKEKIIYILTILKLYTFLKRHIRCN